MIEDKHFPIRGKWDFENDDMRLKAHELWAYDQCWREGWDQGHKDTTLTSWAKPLAIAAIIIAAIFAAPQYILLVHMLVN